MKETEKLGQIMNIVMDNCDICPLGHEICTGDCDKYGEE